MDFIPKSMLEATNADPDSSREGSSESMSNSTVSSRKSSSDGSREGSSDSTSGVRHELYYTLYDSSMFNDEL